MVAAVLAALRDHAAPGVSPSDLDALARDLVADAGAVPSFLGYHPGFASTPYPAVIWASVNDVVGHGIPGPDPLMAGDLLSIDLAVHLGGWCADAAVSTVIGETTDPRDLALISATEHALAAGIAAAQPGGAARGHRARDRQHRAGGRVRITRRSRRARRRPLDARGTTRPQ